MFFQVNHVHRKLVFHKKQEYVLIIFLFLDLFKSFHDHLHLSFILLIIQVELEQQVTRNQLLKRKEVVTIFKKNRSLFYFLI